MFVILLEKVKNLGNLGDKAEVKPGFARSYLIPKQKAVFATEKNMQEFLLRRSELEEKEKQDTEMAIQRASAINKETITIEALVSAEGKLYGSIGVSEIKEALLAKSIEVNKKEIILPEGALHFIGDYVLEIHLGSDVVANLKVQILDQQAK